METRKDGGAQRCKEVTVTIRLPCPPPIKRKIIQPVEIAENRQKVKQNSIFIYLGNGVNSSLVFEA